MLKIFKSLNIIDYIIFFIFAICSFFIFQHRDIIHTSISSLAFLKGHILDFYDYNLVAVEGNNYLPSTYIIYAIWNLPIYFFGLFSVNFPDITQFALFYNKFLGVIFYFLSAFVLYKIGLQIGLDILKSKLLAIIFITSPIAFFSQFIFGQYDIFTVFFLLLGLLYYYKGSRYKYLIFFGLAITFKYHALLFSVPLILIREKNIFRVFLSALILIIPFGLEVLIYSNSPAFISGVFGFKAAHTFHWYVYLSLILLFLFSYFRKHTNSDDEIRFSIFCLTAVSFICFGLSLWHPQWLLIAMPFLALGTVINKRYKLLLIIDIFMMLFFVCQTAVQFSGNVDQNLFILGVLNFIMPDNLNSYLPLKDMIPNVHKYFYFALVSLTLLIHMILKYPKFPYESLNIDITDSVNIIRSRFIIGVMIFIIPVFVSFYITKYFGV